MGGLEVVTPSASDSGAVTLFDRGTGHRYQYFCSSGGIRRLPDDFVFPKMSFATLITSWFCGNESMRTVPFKLLRATEITNKKERYKLSHMKALMLAVEIAAQRVGTWDALARRGSWDVGSTVSLFESVHHFFEYRSNNKCRTAHISWQTVYYLFKSNRKLFATDLE